MRRVVMPILTAGMLLAASAARAQQNAGYAFCMRMYDGGVVSCGFTSMAQCAATASGIGATCYANPSAAPGQAANPPALRRTRPSH
jgi:hypothetical protein